MLRKDYLPDYDLTVSSLAEALGVSRQSLCGVDPVSIRALIRCGKFSPNMRMSLTNASRAYLLKVRPTQGRVLAMMEKLFAVLKAPLQKTPLRDIGRICTFQSLVCRAESAVIKYLRAWQTV
jgi:hypothetical protein